MSPETVGADETRASAIRSDVLRAREPGASYVVGLDSARKVHLYRLYQTRSYEGALSGRANRDGNRRIIEHAFAFARQRLKFRGTPQLIPPSTLFHLPDGARRADAHEPDAQISEARKSAARESRLSSNGALLPDILCIGEFLWGRPVRDRTKTCSSATLVWFQDSFAPPIAESVLQDLRDVDWATIAEDWSW